MATKKEHRQDKKVLLYGAGIFLLGFFGLMYYIKEKVDGENGVTIPTTSSTALPVVAPVGITTATTAITVIPVASSIEEALAVFT